MNVAITEDYGWDTEAAPESSGYINPAVVRLVKSSRARDVLDAGCGNGALCGDLAASGGGLNIIGIDGDARGIEFARKRFPRIRFEVTSFDTPASHLHATSDGLYDCVVSTEVVEHLYSPHELAQFAFEALRPGGQLIITTPYHGYLKNLVLALTHKWDSHANPLWHGGHIKLWSARTLGKLLEDAGFTIVGFEGVGRLPYLWKSMILIARKSPAI